MRGSVCTSSDLGLLCIILSWILLLWVKTLLTSAHVFTTDSIITDSFATMNTADVEALRHPWQLREDTWENRTNISKSWLSSYHGSLLRLLQPWCKWQAPQPPVPLRRPNWISMMAIQYVVVDSCCNASFISPPWEHWWRNKNWPKP